jgi:hypothetical protein
MAKKTNIAIVLDKSSSISSARLNEHIRDMYNSTVDAIIKSKDATNSTYLALVTFAYSATLDLAPTEINRVPSLTAFPCAGQTALFDGVGKAIETLRAIPGDDVDTSYLVIVLTDGEENYSRIHNYISIGRLISELQATGKWTFAYNLPPGAKADFVRRFHVPVDNVREWEGTAAGVRETEVKTSGAISTYFAARSAGLTQSQSFYENVTTNLAKLDTTTVKSTLDDIRKNFKVYTVAAEMAIKPFVEQHTKTDYILGSAYYELTKPEKVQATKNVLLMKRGESAIFGGAKVRELIGLPTDGKTIAKVVPGNHAEFRIFLESRAVNRKLVRGSSVLVDLTKKRNEIATWLPVETPPTSTTLGAKSATTAATAVAS